MFLERALSVIGRAFIGAGVLVFLFVAYQLWGTNLAEAHNQDQLKAQASALFDNSEGPATTSSTSPTSPPPGSTDSTATTQSPSTTKDPALPAPVGEAVAVISIPQINLEKTVVEGTGVSDLKKGPGHYIGTPLPGQPGNAALAGHRTTYGAPFNRIQELQSGAVINVRTKQGSFRYIVTGQKIVDPSDVSVLEPSTDNRLTLTSCHPKYSAAKRLVITAKLVNSPAAAATTTTTTTTPPQSTSGQTTPATPTTPTTQQSLADSLEGANLSGTAESKTPAFLWGMITLMCAVVVYSIAQQGRRWLVYTLGTPFFLMFLFMFFENFSLLLPANA